MIARLRLRARLARADRLWGPVIEDVAVGVGVLLCIGFAVDVAIDFLRWVAA